MKKIITILGTRPEITKLSPLLPLLDKEFEHIIIHTGQHYSFNMDKIFFHELSIREPDYRLDIGSGTHAEQTGKMMIEIEKILLKENPNAVLVFADPNTPLAGALAASKLNIYLVHLEAGCRSFNKKMPEEINRILIDHCSDLLLAPDKKAYDNLLKEGLPKERIKIVGSTAIEASLRNRELARNSNILKKLIIQSGKYILCTIHRAENTDDLNILRNIFCSLNEIAKSIQIVFPMHPRTKKAILNDNSPINKKIKIIEPQGYFNFLKLLDNSLFVMSDSGGIQEEAAALNVPCLILRNETEWTYLTDAKKNMLIGTEPRKIIEKVKYLLSDRKQIDAMKKVNLKLDKEVSRHILCELKNELQQ